MRRWMVVALCLLLCCLTAAPVQAGPWITGGGGRERTGLVGEPVGFLETDKLLELPLGQSASQPIVVGDRIYHLAGEGLWEVQLELKAGTWQATPRLVAKSNHNPNDKKAVQVSSSTPTYSAESGWIYWGTAFGQLWAYDTVHDQAFSHNLDIGCSVVSSPLVLRPFGKDVVIVGQKPVKGACNEPGKLFAVWGWGRPEGPSHFSRATGGWATPSPVPDQIEPAQLVAGADGVGCETGNGLAAKYSLDRNADGSYSLRTVPWGLTKPCVPNGVAGSFAVAGGAVFWLDTTGRLTARRLDTGKPLPGWTIDYIDLPTALGGPGAKAFTNTKPAIYVTGAGPNGELTGTAFVTLRNYTGPGGLNRPGALRGCPDGSRDAPPGGYECPGAPGALVAIDLATRIVTPYHLPTDARFEAWLAANTDPLILTVPNLVLFGDANGTMWGKPLAPGAGDTAAALAEGFRSELSLLKPDEEPMRGSESWSQISGAGVDPAVGTGPGNKRWLLMGVNYLPPTGEEDNTWRTGRLTLIPFGDTFNLRWAGALTAAPQAPWLMGADITVSGAVTLEETQQPLGQLRPDPPGARVTWYIVPEGWDGTAPGQAIPLGASASLPVTMKAGETVPVQFTFRPTAAFPKKGRLLGVIDAETLAQDATRAQGRAAAALLSEESAWPRPKVAEKAGPGLTDNFISLPYDLASVDLAVTALHAQPQIMCSAGTAETTVTWVVANRSPQTLRNIPVVLRVDGETVWKESLVELAAGKTKTMQVPLTLGCSETYAIEVEVNPDEGGRAIDEYGQYTNNSRKQSVSVVDEAGSDGARSVLGNP